MKRYLLVFVIVFVTLTGFSGTRSLHRGPGPLAGVDDVLKSISERLNNYECISYSYYREIHYFSENYHRKTKNSLFVDFKNSKTDTSFRFQIDGIQSKVVFNGSESFFIDKRAKTIKIEHHPSIDKFAFLSGFLNSLVTIKNVLPTLISDSSITKSVSDTVIGEGKYYNISVFLQNKTINGFGGFVPTTIPITILYRIIVDKTTLLPFQVVETANTKPEDYMITSFTDIKDGSAIKPTELSWFYSTYTDTYKLQNDIRLTPLAASTAAPNWKLRYFHKNEDLSLSELKGRPVLLEFWMSNCGHCIAAVPELNILKEKFNDIQLSVIGINRYDQEPLIRDFYERNKPAFSTLMDSSGAITEAYGIDAFPQVVLINEKGIIVYSGIFNQERITQLLSKKL